MRPSAAGVDDALGNAFAVEMRYFLDELVIFEGCRAALADAPQALVVADRLALAGGQGRFLIGYGISCLKRLWPKPAVMGRTCCSGGDRRI